MNDFDLNMVRTFCVLYEERGVTRAAEVLQLTQPTVSHTLKNLRRQFRDELFIRSGRYMEPTHTAEMLYPRLKGGLTQIAEASVRSMPFAPQDAENAFTLWLSDIGELSFLPPIMRALSRQAPKARLDVEPLQVSRVADVLIRGDVDAAILSPLIHTDRLERTVVRQDEYVVIASADHPRVQRTLSTEQYARESHIRMTSEVGHDIPETLADRAGLKRRDVLRISRFAALPTVVHETAALAVVPRLAAEQMMESSNLQVLPFPLPIPAMEVSLYHLPATRQSEAQRWFSDLVKRALSAM